MNQIPKAMREQVWIQKCGKIFERKCFVPWCQNLISVYDFHCGHDVPASKGGPTNLDNLFPICKNCNLSMGNKYTIKEWSELATKIKKPRKWFKCCGTQEDT